MSTTLRELKDVFDIVRLVDPANNCVLRLNEDGSLSPGGACTSVWGRDEVCKNCISAKAMKLKTRLCRLEFTETDIFHVTAQYVELNGQPCVLELISKIDNGRWLDSGDKRLLLENAQAPRMTVRRPIPSPASAPATIWSRRSAARWRWTVWPSLTRTCSNP